MKHWETTDPEWGRILHLSDGKTEVSAALDFGIRVVGLSAAGERTSFTASRRTIRNTAHRKGGGFTAVTGCGRLRMGTGPISRITLRFPGSFRKRAFLWSRRIRGSGSRSG